MKFLLRILVLYILYGIENQCENVTNFFDLNVNDDLIYEPISSEDGEPISSKHLPETTTETLRKENFEISHRRKGPLNYARVKDDESFRSFEGRQKNEIIDSDEFIEILHQPFMVPIDQFQLQIRAKNVVKNNQKSSAAITSNSNRSVDPISKTSIPKSGSSIASKNQNSSNVAPKVNNKIEGSGDLVENLNDVDHSGDVNQGIKISNSGIEESEIEASGKGDSIEGENSTDGSGIEGLGTLKITNDLGNTLILNSTNPSTSTEKPVTLLNEEVETIDHINMDVNSSDVESILNNKIEGSGIIVENLKDVDHSGELNQGIEISNSVIDEQIMEGSGKGDSIEGENSYEIISVTNDSIYEDTKELGFPNRTQSDHILLLEEWEHQDDSKNISKFSNKIIDNYVISPQYLIQNKPVSSNSKFMPIDIENDLMVNIVPLKLEPGNELTDIEVDDTAPEKLDDEITGTIENGTTYRFVFPTLNKNADDSKTDSHQHFISHWINEEQVLVDESGLPKDCANYVEKVIIGRRISELNEYQMT